MSSLRFSGSDRNEGLISSSFCTKKERNRNSEDTFRKDTVSYVANVFRNVGNQFKGTPQITEIFLVCKMNLILSFSQLQSLAQDKLSSDPKAGASASDAKSSGTAVADLVDLELELNSLQQGLNQMERITPSDPFGSKDDPFGDSFISYPVSECRLLAFNACIYVNISLETDFATATVLWQGTVESYIGFE